MLRACLQKDKLIGLSSFSNLACAANFETCLQEQLSWGTDLHAVLKAVYICCQMWSVIGLSGCVLLHNTWDMHDCEIWQINALSERSRQPEEKEEDESDW